MKTLKQIFVYLIWVVVSLMLGIGYMRIILGPREKPTTILSFIFNLIYDLGLFHVGIRIGLIIAFLYVLLDVFFLKKKLKYTIKTVGIRFMILLAITCIVAIIHYILEKVIDII